MKELLAKLKKLDPETENQFDFDDLDDLSLADMDLIQGACQRAIAARGWNWQVQIWNTTNLKFYIAYVVGDGHEDGAQADSPAKAILTAYLAAIEAQT